MYPIPTTSTTLIAPFISGIVGVVIFILTFIILSIVVISLADKEDEDPEIDLNKPLKLYEEIVAKDEKKNVSDKNDEKNTYELETIQLTNIEQNNIQEVIEKSHDSLVDTQSLINETGEDIERQIESMNNVLNSTKKITFSTIQVLETQLMQSKNAYGLYLNLFKSIDSDDKKYKDKFKKKGSNYKTLLEEITTRLLKLKNDLQIIKLE